MRELEVCMPLTFPYFTPLSEPVRCDFTIPDFDSSIKDKPLCDEILLVVDRDALVSNLTQPPPP